MRVNVREREKTEFEKGLILFMMDILLKTCINVPNVAQNCILDIIIFFPNLTSLDRDSKLKVKAEQKILCTPTHSDLTSKKIFRQTKNRL